MYLLNFIFARAGGLYSHSFLFDGPIMHLFFDIRPIMHLYLVAYPRQYALPESPLQDRGKPLLPHIKIQNNENI